MTSLERFAVLRSKCEKLEQLSRREHSRLSFSVARTKTLYYLHTASLSRLVRRELAVFVWTTDEHKERKRDL